MIRRLRKRVRVAGDSQSAGFHILGPLAAAAVLCTSCANNAPIEEVRLFSAAYSTFNSATQPLLDDLALAERHQGRMGAVMAAKNNGLRKSRYKGECKNVSWRKPGFMRGFCNRDAGYFSEIGDPPATKSFRRSMMVIGNYADVLLTLAEGRNLDEAVAQVELLGGNVASLISVAGVPGAGAGVTGALKALEPVLRRAGQAGNEEELKRLVLGSAPQMKVLVASLRAAAPVYFKTLIHAPESEATSNPNQAAPYLKRIETYRVIVSNYVILLEELSHTFDQLLVAFEAKRNPVSIGALANGAARLSMEAEAWRRSYSALRTAIP